MLLGEHLKELFGLKDSDIEKALTLQKDVGDRIGQVLIQMSAITDSQLLKALSCQLNIPLFERDSSGSDSQDVLQFLSGKVDFAFLSKNHMFPLNINQKDKTITYVTNDPLNYSVMNYLIHQVQYKILPMLAAETTISELWKPHENPLIDDLVSLRDEDDSERLKEIAFEVPVIKMLNNIVSRGLELRASDIHLEPLESRARVRFRIDGILHDMEELDHRFYLAIASRIKLLASLDIAEKRLPQDGKFTTKVATTILDVRVSTMPTSKGEGVVMRLLARERVSIGKLTSLGFESDHAKILDHKIRQPYGILLITGPTGSGKTTTLYSMLTSLNSSEKKIVTVEDPIEYQLKGINQIQVKSEIGLSFAAVLRSVLRHDPDIIMVGEIRDSETAATAIQSALTGHLVLSTLHTNDAPSSLFRLIEMGVEDYLINAAVIGVLAQRVVRQNCSFCTQPDKMNEELLDAYQLFALSQHHSHLTGGEINLMRGAGCGKCARTGYRGRLAIGEVFEYTESCKQIFLRHRSLDLVKENLRKESGYRNLREDGLLKVAKGLTTLDEILRVT